MPTRNTMVVPCMVNMRLNVAGETKGVVGKEQLDADQQGFNSRHDEKDERVTDVEDAEFLVVDRHDPAMDQFEVGAAMGVCGACGRCPLRFLPRSEFPVNPFPSLAPVYFRVSR